MNLAPWVWYLLLILLVGCQTPQNPTVRRPAVETVAATQVLEQVEEPLPEQPVFAALEKQAPRGSVAMQGTTLRMSLQLPPLPEKTFQTQLLDLGTASKILATVTDSHGKTYTPVGADGNGRVNYPVNGVVALTFNNVLPDALLLAELKVLDTGLAHIPQADMAVALRHTGVTNPAAVTINFQTGAVAKTLKALLALNATRARTLDIAQLNTLMASITGQGGTAPNFTYAQVHPTLVKIPELVTALVANNPNTLTATTYRANGATINLNVSGLTGTDRLQVQITDAASVVKTNLSNGNNQLLTKVTPGTGLKVKVSAFGTPAVTYSYTATPSNLPTLIEGGTQNVTITATPNLTLTGFSPAFGPAGTQVVITGTGFSGSPSVSFNGVAATVVTVDSPTQITATVPPTAIDGLISVTQSSTVTSASPFNVHRRIYVKANASGTNNGTSWTNAYTSLQTALSNAGENDDIWVAAGTYKPHASDIEASFAPSVNNLRIYGGFVGNETMLEARNVAANTTLLSGDLQGDDNTAVTPFTSATANSNIVVTLEDKTNITLDGLIIQGAQQLGLFANNAANVQLRNLTVRHNKGSVGAGIQITNATFTAENLTVTRNAATSRGGGLSLIAGALGTITHSVFEFNQAGGGGGISFERDSSATITNSQFNNNSTSGVGGAILIINGNSGTLTNGNITISNVIFKNNSGLDGSALRVDSLKGVLNVNRAAVIGNTYGQPLSFNLYNGQSIPTSITLSNLLVANNTSLSDTSIIIDGEGSAYASGVALRNITLANNTCTGGSGSRCSIANTILSKSTYQNVLFWKDQMGTAAATSGGNIDLGTGGTPFLAFEDPDGADNVLFTADDGYTLRSGVAAINAGVNNANVPSQDITLRNRNGAVDAGAYEYIP